MGVKLVSIVSAGHSGSTLLDLVIGSIPSCFSTGELTYLPWQISRRESRGPDAELQKLCSCGGGFHECPVWSRVIKNISTARGFDILEDRFLFKISLLQGSKFTCRPYWQEQASRILFATLAKYRSLTPLAGIYGVALSDVINNNWQLFESIAESTGAKFIVDSSKSEFRARLLHSRRPADVYLVVLFRDIRGVAFSEKKLGNDPVKRAAGWVRQYNRIYSVLNDLPGINILSVNYEDLVLQNSEHERMRIAEFIGVDNIDPRFQIDTRQYHLVAGNRMRHKGLIEIRRDVAWESGLCKKNLGKLTT